MSIREIWTQAHFAELSFGNINLKAQRGTDLVFSSIHSFLSHCAMVSKLLNAEDDSQPPKTIGGVLNIPETSVIHTRTFRNHLEHYDERLKAWIRQFGPNVNIGTYNIGSKQAINIPNLVFISHYDPNNQTFTFVNEDFNLGILFTEVNRIKSAADAWVKKMEQGNITTPYV